MLIIKKEGTTFGAYPLDRTREHPEDNSGKAQTSIEYTSYTVNGTKVCGDMARRGPRFAFCIKDSPLAVKRGDTIVNGTEGSQLTTSFPSRHKQTGEWRQVLYENVPHY